MLKVLKQIEQNENVSIGRNPRSKLTAEVDSYINEECISESSLEDIINYWDSKKNQFKILYHLSQKYLYLLASSTSSERLFSHASGFYSTSRTLLAPSHLEQSCILHTWLISEGFDLFENMKFESK